MQTIPLPIADNLIMSCTVWVIILLNRIRIIWVKSSAILIALVIGYILAGFMGHLNFSVLQEAPFIQFQRQCILV
jgi:xanthine permease XanP